MPARGARSARGSAWDYLLQADNITADPQFLDVSAPDPFDWDLHLAAGSDLVDAGDPDLARRDPDNTIGDIGPFGGPGAGGWDLDWDGWYDWWHPGAYDPANDPARIGRTSWPSPAPPSAGGGPAEWSRLDLCIGCIGHRHPQQGRRDAGRPSSTGR